MNFRTREHYENRLNLLLAKGEVKNANLIKKIQRKLRFFENK